MNEGAIRLDKWLWYARFFKTRSLATEQCTAGRIRVDGSVVRKGHHPARPGQVLTFVQGHHVRVVKVVALGVRRGPASEAATLYEDLAPPTTDNRLPRTDDALAHAVRDAGAGRPTKKERRQMGRHMERVRGAD